MAITVQDRFRLRRGTAAALTAANETPLADEIVIESDTGLTDGARKMKIGDGVTAWNDLPYLAIGGGAPVGDVVRPAGNAYTVAATDNGNTILSGDATGFALTVPTDSSVDLPIGAKVAYTQGAAGPITVTGASGVAVHAPNGNTTGALFDGGVAEKIGANEWQLWNGPALGPLATSDAPSDGKTYGRKNGAWAEATGGGSGDITAVNEQTGTTYTLALADATKGVRCTNASAIALTIPTNATAALPLYCSIPVFQGGAGVVTVSGATGVTLEAPNGAATKAIGDFRTLFLRATNVWVIG